MGQQSKDELMAGTCRAYVLVAWIWSFAWYLLLDPLKWAMAYIMNEDGFRSQGRWKAANRKRGAARRLEQGEKGETVPGHMDQVRLHDFMMCMLVSRRTPDRNSNFWNPDVDVKGTAM